MMDRAAAAEEIAAGGVVAIPSETFYGLAADPRNPAALQRLLDIKGRDARDKPILLLVGGLDDIGPWIRDLPPAFHKVVAHFWPGPLTLVLPAAVGIPVALTGGSDGVAIRFTSHPVAQSLIGACGTALTGTSANMTGHRPSTDPAEVEDSLGGRISGVLDGGETFGGEASTVLDLCHGEPAVLRPGAVSAVAIERVLRLV